MQISVNIQTYKRAGFVDTLKLCPSAFIWAHEFEVEEYRKAYPGANVKSLPDELRGNLPKVKNYILEKNKDFDVNVLLDDDISKIGYYKKGLASKVMSEKELLQIIANYSIICMDWGLKLWGIQVNQDKQCYREYSPFSTLSYVSSSFSCFIKGNELQYDERFPLKEDYDMTIQQCMKYRGILRVNKFFYVKKSAENIGGCGVYRNVEREKDQLKLLQKKWGDKIVKEDNHESRSHSSNKKRAFDINPIIKIPIKGI